MRLSKVIIAPDSFKGAISSVRATEIIAAEINAAFPNCEIVKMPIADGGEGSVETILAAIGGQVVKAQALSPDDRMIGAKFGIAASGAAIVEMAQSSGITRQDGLHPMTSSTYGFGQLIMAALERGARDFNLCIGGSATTDGGCGMAAALGVLFYDKNGGSFVPCGGTLREITRIDAAGIDERVSGSSFTVMCDVDNPLFGINGAAYIYGPQKGASDEQVLLLDEGLRHLGAVLSENFSENFANIPGAGAAGGLGAGCMAFLGASLMSGIEAMLKLCSFESHRAGTDLIITGEGKLDSQSFSGKVLSGILQQAGGIPVWSICGVCECDETLLRSYDLTVFEASEGVSIEESMREPEKYLRKAARRAVQRIISDGL